MNRLNFLLLGVVVCLLALGCTKKENNNGANPSNGESGTNGNATTEDSIDDYVFLGYGEFDQGNLDHQLSKIPQSEFNSLLTRSDIITRSDTFPDDKISELALNSGITTPVPVPVDTIIESLKTYKNYKKSVTASTAAIGVRLKSISQECTHPFVPLYLDENEILHYYLIANKNCENDKFIMAVEYFTGEGAAEFKVKMEETENTLGVLSIGNQIYSISDTPKAYGEKKISGGVVLDLDTELSIFGYADTKYLAINKIGLVGRESKIEFTITPDAIESLEIKDISGGSSGDSLPQISNNQFNKVTITYPPQGAGKKQFAVIVNEKLNLPLNLFVADELENKFNTLTEFQNLKTFNIPGLDYKTPLIASSQNYYATSYYNYNDSNFGYTATINTYNNSDNIIQNQWISDKIPTIYNGGTHEETLALFFDGNYQIGLRQDLTEFYAPYYKLFSRNISTGEIIYKDINLHNLEYIISMDVNQDRDTIAFYNWEENKLYLFDSITLEEIASYAWQDCAVNLPRDLSLSVNSQGQYIIYFVSYNDQLSETFRLCIINGEKLEPVDENVTEYDRFYDIALFPHAPIIVAGTTRVTPSIAIFDGLTSDGKIFKVEEDGDWQHNALRVGKLSQFIDISADNYYTAYAYIFSATEVRIAIQAGEFVDDRKTVTISTSSLVTDLSMKFIGKDSILISLVNSEGLVSYIVE